MFKTIGKWFVAVILTAVICAIGINNLNTASMSTDDFLYAQSLLGAGAAIGALLYALLEEISRDN